MKNDDDEIKKIKFHIQQLANAIDYNSYPVENMVLMFDWSESDLDKAHDVFEKMERRLEKSKDFTHIELELELEQSLGLSYQQVKQVAIAFYRNKQWTPVCIHYAKSFGNMPPVELFTILNGE